MCTVGTPDHEIIGIFGADDIPALGNACSDTDGCSRDAVPGGANLVALHLQRLKALSPDICGDGTEAELPLADDGVHDQHVGFHANVCYDTLGAAPVHDVPLSGALGDAFLDDLGDAVLLIHHGEETLAEHLPVPLLDLVGPEYLDHHSSSSASST